MSGGEWTTQRERKQAAADARELLRQQIRNEKRDLRDLRFIAQNQTIPPDKAAEFWQQLLQLQQEHGKEGHTEFWWSLVPRWEQIQLSRGGGLCPDNLKPQGAPRLTQTQIDLEAALKRAATNSRTIEASQVLQAWAMEDGTL